MIKTMGTNAILKITGDISHIDEVSESIDFIIRRTGWYEPFTRDAFRGRPSFQLLDDGITYCIGSCTSTKEWEEYPFDYDPKIISLIVMQYFDNNEAVKTIFENAKHNLTDPKINKIRRGFIMSTLEKEDLNKITLPQYCIMVIRPYVLIYGK